MRLCEFALQKEGSRVLKACMYGYCCGPLSS